MLLKVQRIDTNRANAWQIFDAVENPKWTYYSIKHIDEIIKKKVFPGSTCLLFCHDKQQGNFVLVEFWSKGIYYFIASNVSIYLLNDAGKTIENLRY